MLAATASAAAPPAFIPFKTAAFVAFLLVTFLLVSGFITTA
jgi:hypothetical protein